MYGCGGRTIVRFVLFLCLTNIVESLKCCMIIVILICLMPILYASLSLIVQFVIV